MQSVSDFAWERLRITETTLVHTGAGALHTLTLNHLDDDVTVTVYDGIDGTGEVIAVIDTDLHQPTSLIYDADIQTGIYITIVASEQGSADLTVTFV